MAAFSSSMSLDQILALTAPAAKLAVADTAPADTPAPAPAETTSDTAPSVAPAVMAAAAAAAPAPASTRADRFMAALGKLSANANARHLALPKTIDDILNATESDSKNKDVIKRAYLLLALKRFYEKWDESKGIDGIPQCVWKIYLEVVATARARADAAAREKALADKAKRDADDAAAREATAKNNAEKLAQLKLNLAMKATGTADLAAGTRLFNEKMARDLAEKAKKDAAAALDMLKPDAKPSSGAIDELKRFNTFMASPEGIAVAIGCGDFSGNRFASSFSLTPPKDVVATKVYLSGNGAMISAVQALARHPGARDVVVNITLAWDLAIHSQIPYTSAMTANNFFVRIGNVAHESSPAVFRVLDIVTDSSSGKPYIVTNKTTPVILRLPPQFEKFSALCKRATKEVRKCFPLTGTILKVEAYTSNSSNSSSLQLESRTRGDTCLSQAVIDDFYASPLTRSLAHLAKQNAAAREERAAAAVAAAAAAAAAPAPKTSGDRSETVCNLTTLLARGQITKAAFDKAISALVV